MQSMPTNLAPGIEPPYNLRAIIEIPAESGPVKYEIDKTTGLLEVDRFIATPMFYPTNYGYIPGTLSDDGDPLDILVVTPTPLVHGALINCRPIGLLAMTDESGVDAKIIAVPQTKLTKAYDHIQNCDDLPQTLKAGIEHFFTRYKDLEANKWVKIEGWQPLEEAVKIINQSIEQAQCAHG